jgi:hypothetical protein
MLCGKESGRRTEVARLVDPVLKNILQEDEDVKDWTNKLGTADFGIREDDVGNQDPGQRGIRKRTKNCSKYLGMEDDCGNRGDLPFRLGLFVRTSSAPFVIGREFEIQGINARSMQL